LAVILLDTNVVSELTRPAPADRVRRWLDALDETELYICSITVAELKLGVALLPDGKRRHDLAERVDAAIQEFAGFCVAYDALAAEHYAVIVASRRRIGRPISYADAQIAAIARSAGVTLATRNADDFSDIDGLTVVDPWQ
jgi:hypothetical protein